MCADTCLTPQLFNSIATRFARRSSQTSLYYLLSNNYINELISIPLDHYPAEVLDELMPTYISFLKTLALRLSGSPTLFQFFVDELSGSTFPLFTAAVTAASSEYAKTDSFVRLTALNIVVNVCKIEHDAIRRVIGESVDEQKVRSDRAEKGCLGIDVRSPTDPPIVAIASSSQSLLTVLTSRLNSHILHIIRLSTGSLVDSSRSEQVSEREERIKR